MPVVRRPDGTLALATSDGLTVPLGEGHLSSLGYEIPPLTPPLGRTAFVGDTDQSGMGGQGNVPEVRTDVPREVPGAGGAGGTSGRTQDQGGGVGAPAAPEMRPREPAPPDAEPAQKPPELRSGAEYKKLDQRPEAAASQQQTPRARVIPGGDERAGFTVQRGQDPETVAAIGQSLGKAAGSEITAREAEAQQASDLRRYEAGLLGDQIAQQEASVTAGRERLQAVRQEVQSRQLAIDADREKLAAREQDSPNYWANKGALAKIIAFIGAAASGAQQGLQGGPNQYLEHIRSEIALDMEEHRRKLAAREKGIRFRQDQLDKLSSSMDPDLAEKELEARKLTIVGLKMKRFANVTGDPAAAARLNADADRLIAEARTKFGGISQELGDRVVEQWRYRPAQVVGGGAPASEKDVHQYGRDLASAGIYDLDAKIGALDDLIGELPADGDLPTPDTRNVVSRGVRSAADYLGGTGSGSALLDSPEQRRATAKVMRIKGAVKHELSGTATSPSEAAAIDAQMDQINTPQGLRDYVKEKKRELQRRRAATAAGSTPAAVQTYDARKNAYSPPSRPSGLQGEQ